MSSNFNQILAQIFERYLEMKPVFDAVLVILLLFGVAVLPIHFLKPSSKNVFALSPGIEKHLLG